MPFTVQQTVFDVETYTDLRYEQTPTNRDGYDSYLLLFNIYGYYKHSLQFDQIFKDEKSIFVCINEHLTKAPAVNLISQYFLTDDEFSFLATRLKNSEIVKIPNFLCIKGFEPRIQKTVHVVGLYSNTNQLKVLAKKLEEAISFLQSLNNNEEKHLIIAGDLNFNSSKNFKRTNLTVRNQMSNLNKKYKLVDLCKESVTRIDPMIYTNNSSIGHILISESIKDYFKIDILAKMDQCDHTPIVLLIKNNGYIDNFKIINHIETKLTQYFYCNRCDYFANNLRSLKTHKKKHFNKNCNKCDKKFYEKKLFNQHDLTCGENNSSDDICNVCGESSKKLNEHLKSHYFINYVCKYCNLKCKNISILQWHHLANHAIQSYYCTICDNYFSHLQQFKYHMKVYH